MKQKLTLFALLIVVSACAPIRPINPTASMTDAQVSNLNDPQLCALSQYNDMRINNRIIHEKTDCAEDVLICKGQGYKKGTKSFKKCQADYTKQMLLRQKRAANPAWAYCTDNNFKDGTSAMATCMNGWQDRQIQAAALQQQQQQIYMLQQQQALQNLQQQQALQNLQRQQAFQAQMQQLHSYRPTTTTCNRIGNTLNCNTW